jgi:hypothetical protein
MLKAKRVAGDKEGNGNGKGSRSIGDGNKESHGKEEGVKRFSRRVDWWSECILKAIYRS